VRPIVVTGLQTRASDTYEGVTPERSARLGSWNDDAPELARPSTTANRSNTRPLDCRREVSKAGQVTRRDRWPPLLATAPRRAQAAGGACALLCAGRIAQDVAVS